MTVGDFLANTTNVLINAGITTARLDALILLEDVLQIDRAHLLARTETKIPRKTEVELNKKIMQRATHQPLAYLRGKAMFYGREFFVSHHVLVPRPESEAIISLLKTLPLAGMPTIVDVGTGSGCLGITAALEIPGAKVWLCDIDAKALTVAAQNAKKHRVAAQLLESGLLDSFPVTFDVLLANLPYVPVGYPINKAAQHEPTLALFSGKDGLDLYRRLWKQISQLKHQPNHVLTESLPGQHKELTALARAAGYRQTSQDGLVQCFSLLSRGHTKRNG